MEISFPEPAEKENPKFFFFLSVSSWILLIITSWTNLLYLGASEGNLIIIWLNHNYDDSSFCLNPLFIHYFVFRLVFILSFILVTIGFVIYIYYMYEKDEDIIREMYGKITKFHFIPFLCISGLFLISESTSLEIEEKDWNVNYYDESELKYIISLILTLLGIALLIVLCLNIKLESPWYVVLSINKGAFSCLIALLVYNLGSTFTNYGYYKKRKDDDENEDDYYKWLKNCGIAFSIIIGFINNGFAFLLKDILLSFMNFLIYLGMTISFFKINDDEREKVYDNYAIGIIDSIMMGISFVYIIFHLSYYKAIIPKLNKNYYY